jgi:hypothetical protein
MCASKDLDSRRDRYWQSHDVNTFSVGDTVICYNGTHLGRYGNGQMYVNKRGPPNSKSPSISAIPLTELALPSSPYTVSGQIFSLVPISGDAAKWAWTGEFVSLSLNKKATSAPGSVSHLKNLRFAVSSRLIDPMHENARETPTDGIHWPAFTSTQDKTWVFSSQHLLATWNRLWTRLFSDVTLHNKFSNLQVFLRDFPPIKRRL